MPAFAIWLSWALFPLVYAPDVLGGVHDFSDCTILQYNETLAALVPTNETLEIARVDHEIKLVQAKTYEGALYGLGFVHAKDRLFQLHMLRMLAQGRLSELIGSEGLQVDKYIRQIGVTRATQARLNTLDPVEEAALLNYAAGINKVAHNLKVYPVEFYVLFTSFHDWTVKDSVACQYLYNALASADWFAEMLRLRLLEVYDRELVDQLIPYKSEHTFKFDKSSETLTDFDLEQAGFNLLDSQDIFNVDESLIYMPPKKEKLGSDQ